MVNDSQDMRLKRSFKTIVILVVFFFVIKAYNYITKPKSKLFIENSIVLQADPFDDKEDPSFDKFQRANEILHGNDLEKYLIKDDKISNDNLYGNIENGNNGNNGNIIIIITDSRGNTGHLVRLYSLLMVKIQNTIHGCFRHFV